jgi:spore coat protein U-like protein
MRFGTYAFALSLSVSGLVVNQAYAATASASFSVTATVVDRCNVSANSVTPDSYTTLRNDARSAVSVACDLSSPYTVELTAGTGAAVTTVVPISSGIVATPGLAPTSNSTQARSRTLSIPNASFAGTFGRSTQIASVYNTNEWKQFLTPGNYPESVTIIVTY